MTELKKWLRENFGYSKKEINGTFVLVILISAGFLATYAVDYYLYASSSPDHKSDLELLRKWAAELEWKEKAPVADVPSDTERKAGGPGDIKLKPKPFDPNRVTKQELLQMNLPGYLASNWTKYLKSGGTLKKKTDLLKLYGMDSAIFGELEAYITLPDPAPAKVDVTGLVASPHALRDINLATAEELQAVRGIGPAYSSRIIKYRDMLGGFSSKGQLTEVYGLKREVAQAVWEKFSLDSASCCTRTSLNQIDADSLRKHPYLSWNQANAIVAYRRQHGPFGGWHDLEEIKIIPDSLVRKLKPYFDF